MYILISRPALVVDSCGGRVGSDWFTGDNHRVDPHVLLLVAPPCAR